MSKFAYIPRDVDVNKIVLSDKAVAPGDKAGGAGGRPGAPAPSARTVYLSYGDDKGLVIETPYLKCPFGLSIWDGQGKGADQHSIEVSFSSGMSSKDEVADFENLVKTMDDRFIEDFLKNSSKWLTSKKTYSDRLLVEDRYTRMHRMAKDKVTKEPTTDYPATFKMKLKMKNDDYDCSIVDANGNPFTLTKANTQGAHIKAIVKCVGLWVAGTNNFGATWKVMNLMVIPRDTVKNYTFRAMPTPVAAIADAPAPPAAPATKSPTYIEDTDDEDAEPITVVSNKASSSAASDDDEDDDDIDPPPVVVKRGGAGKA